MKIVINRCFGGFTFSKKADERLAELGYDTTYLYEPKLNTRAIARDDPRAVQVVEELGAAASEVFSRLEVVEIPDGVKWHIHEYDGAESIHEDHRTWPEDAKC